MEKIGLFDLIDKFATPKTDEKSFRPAENPTHADGSNARGDKQNARPASETMHDPDFGVQPQYMMNLKMQAFLRRHENLKADIPPKPQKRAEKAPRAEKIYTDKPARSEISGATLKTRAKKTVQAAETAAATTKKRVGRTKKADVKPE